MHSTAIRKSATLRGSLVLEDRPPVEDSHPGASSQLTPEDLEAEVPPRTLTAQRTTHVYPTCRFSFDHQSFQQNDQIDTTEYHFHREGIWLKVGSTEHKSQLENQARKEKKCLDFKEPFQPIDHGDQGSQAPRLSLFEFGQAGCFSAQPVRRHKGVSTPAIATTSTKVGTSCQDEDERPALGTQPEGESQAPPKVSVFEPDESLFMAPPPEIQPTDTDILYSEGMQNTLLATEAFVVQNREIDVYHDFKFWDDAADKLRPGEGSLLPLWRFGVDIFHKKQITALAWNTQHEHLFAVAFGSYDYLHPVSGGIAVFSLRNTRNPEYAFKVQTGVASLDWHPHYPELLVVGLFNGSVQVYDVRGPFRNPLYESTVKCHQHSAPVWQVRWTHEEDMNQLSFYSISSDGRVCQWSLKRSELECDTRNHLKLVNNLFVSNSTPGSLNRSVEGLASGSAFDFHPSKPEEYLVGTEEGEVHLCSRIYDGKYLKTYAGHDMAVYAIKWNRFHPEIFISSSADWSVRIWDARETQALLELNLKDMVGDVTWAPQVATIFGCVTNDGHIHVYNLSEKLMDPMCKQRVSKTAKLTHLEFSRGDPVLVATDDRGLIHVTKLSPNLRGPGNLSLEDQLKVFDDLDRN